MIERQIHDQVKFEHNSQEFLLSKQVVEIVFIVISHKDYSKLKGTYKITNSSTKTYPIDKTDLNVNMLKFMQIFLVLRQFKN